MCLSAPEPARMAFLEVGSWQFLIADEVLVGSWKQPLVLYGVAGVFASLDRHCVRPVHG